MESAWRRECEYGVFVTTRGYDIRYIPRTERKKVRAAHASNSSNTVGTHQRCQARTSVGLDYPRAPATSPLAESPIAHGRTNAVCSSVCLGVPGADWRVSILYFYRWRSRGRRHDHSSVLHHSVRGSRAVVVRGRRPDIPLLCAFASRRGLAGRGWCVLCVGSFRLFAEGDTLGCGVMLFQRQHGIHIRCCIKIGRAMDSSTHILRA